MKKWDKVELYLAGITIALALLISFAEVVARFIFGFSFYWAKEYILFFIIWSTFLSSSQVLKRGKHIRLSFVVELLPPKFQKYMEIITSILGAIFCVILLVSGYQLVIHAFESGVTTTSLAKTPLWIPYSIMPIAGLLFSIRFIEHFIEVLTAGRKS